MIVFEATGTFPFICKLHSYSRHKYITYIVFILCIICLFTFCHSIHHLLGQSNNLFVQLDSELVPIYAIHPIDHLYDLVIPDIFAGLHKADSGCCVGMGRDGNGLSLVRRQDLVADDTVRCLKVTAYELLVGTEILAGVICD